MLSPQQKTIDDFEQIDKLGGGSYGDVILVRSKENSQLYAIKILEKKLLLKEKKQYQVFIEKEVLARIQHPGLINLHYSFQNATQIFLVLDYVEGGDLANFLKINQKLPQQAIVFYTAEIVSILEVLHLNGIAHRDVKPENIMVTNNLHLRMIDFGTANFFDTSSLPDQIKQRIEELRDISRRDERFDEIEEYQKKHKSTFVGTAEYVSPELLEDDICGPQADLWALGCIIYKMYTGTTPFNDMNEYLVFQKIRNGHYSKNAKIPQDAQNLIDKLLQRDPMSRLGAGINQGNNSYQTLKAHPFFREIDWNSIWKQQGPKGLQIHLRKSSTQDFHVTKSKSLVKSEVVLTGLVNKKTGWMIYKPRNMILFDYDIPRLEYFEPETGIKKGQIILDKNVKLELLKGQFNIDVPSKKKYYFKECEHPANVWIEKIKEVMKRRLI